MKIDWKRKLSSRKFWVFVAAFAVSVVMLFTSGPEIADKISGVILALGSVVVYTIGESAVDAAHKDENEVDEKKKK